MAQWNLGDILDAIEPALPADTPALIHGARVITWAEMGARSNNIARSLAAHGLSPGAKVAFYMRNRPEYGELMAACFKGRLPSDILDLARWKIGEEITSPEGILFVPYGTLRSSRVEDSQDGAFQLFELP